MQCKYALFLSYLKLHISLLEVGSKVKYQCIGEDTNTIEWFESSNGGQVQAKFPIAKVTEIPCMFNGGIVMTWSQSRSAFQPPKVTW
jgi:hypothetical protein